MEKSDLVSAMQEKGLTIHDLFAQAGAASERGDWRVWQNLMFAILILVDE